VLVHKLPTCMVGCFNNEVIVTRLTALDDG
jgi:hypothetical protein